ncbi:MAG: FtsX-like permease family protein [Ethanoligenens sp.]
MLNENGIARRYLTAQKKRTVLLTLGVVLAIALISTLFSLLNLLQAFEVRMEVRGSGVWHVMATGCTPAQAAALQKRVDVSASGRLLKVTQDTQLQSTALQSLYGADAGGLTQRNQSILSGRLPLKADEIALENWALQRIKPGARIGDSLMLSTGQTSQSYRLTGILEDNDDNKTNNLFAAWISLGAAQTLNGSHSVNVLMQVAGGVDINQFVKSIQKEQHLSAGQVTPHTTLLAALGRSHDKEVLGIYAVGAVLAALVLFAAIVMIYNAFNMSVTQRIRQFGLLRAMGATPAQIRRMVRAEAGQISLLGVLPGVVLGAAVTIALNLFLRHMFPVEFGGDAPVLFISWPSLGVGAVIGVLGTLVSALRPASRAGKVSPVEAIAAITGTNIKKRKAMGVATHVLPVETAIALRQVLVRKRSFLLTAISLAFGILLLLAFSPVTDMLLQGTRHNFDLGDAYAASTTKGQGFSDATVQSFSRINGVQSVSAKRIDLVDATFSYSLLGENYKRSIRDAHWAKAANGANGMVQTTEKSILAGLSNTDIRALQSDLIAGSIDSAQLNRENGVLLMLNNTPALLNVSDLQPGDTIRINGRTMTICGIVQANAVLYMFNTSGGNPLLGMYTTNQVFNTFSSISPNLVTMTLHQGVNGNTVVSRIKEQTAGIPGVLSGNQQPAQQESRNTQMVGNVFLYGFIGVIGLIGVLNIINTIGTNVLVRTREIGLLRAGGMTMGQVTAMLVSESVLYGVLALLIGLTAGIPLNHQFSQSLVQRVYGMPWQLPWSMVGIASAISVLAIFLSLISPLRHIKKLEITRAVTVE